MSVLVLLGLLLFLGLVSGSIFGWMTFFRLGRLESRIEELQRALKKLSAEKGVVVERDSNSMKDRDAWSDSPESSPESSPVPPAQGKENQSQSAPEGIAEYLAETTAPFTSESSSSSLSGSGSSGSGSSDMSTQDSNGVANTDGEYIQHPAPVKVPAKPTFMDTLIGDIKARWMIWLGGICVALSGIFMVKYGIDSGLLGPRGRIALGVISGVALHVAAEWLRRLRGSPHPSFAALAGGASITLYAAFLAALQLYQMIPPLVTFAVLAMVSLATMYLSLRHGPTLAILGLLGAYVVPVLVSTGSQNITGALIYSLIISASALLLMRYVYRPWLWGGLLVGAMGWWLISLTGFDAESFRGHYLAIFAYLVLAIPAMNFSLQKALPDNHPLQQGWSIAVFGSHRLYMSPLYLAITAVMVASALSMATEFDAMAQFGDQYGHQFLYHWAPVTAIVIFAAGYQQQLRRVPWLFLLLQVMALFVSRLIWSEQKGFSLVQLGANSGGFLIFAVFMTLIFSGISLLHLKNAAIREQHLWSSLLMLTPLIWLALSYLLVSDLSRSWGWGVSAIIFGFVYLLLAGRRLKSSAGDIPAIWLIFGGHAGYSLAAAILFREAGLTLALAVQLLSLAWLITHFRLNTLDWLVKLIIAIVVVRLTFNPWLLSYPSNVHWSLWSYGGATLFTALAAYQLRGDSRLCKWLEAAALHLLVLTLAAELRYWLYEGQIFSYRYTLPEAAVNTVLWCGLSLCYFYRARFAASLAGFYISLSRLLLLASFVNYLLVLTSLNPLWQVDNIASTPLFNLLLLAYGAPVLMALLVMRFHQKAYYGHAAVVAGAGLFVFVSMEIRHLWQGALSIYHDTGSGELYTYSIVWLLLAVAAILMAYLKVNQKLYRAGVALLALVIAKIFLIDMSDLEGLLRVASFMGLGLALLGLAYLHRSLAPSREEE